MSPTTGVTSDLDIYRTSSPPHVAQDSAQHGGDVLPINVNYGGIVFWYVRNQA